MTLWWTGLGAIAVATNLVTITPLWPGRLQAGIVEVAFSRMRHAAFEQDVDQIAGQRRVVVFVEADPADRHIDLVNNRPSLDTDVLIARYRPGETDLTAARALFPDRDAYLFRAAFGTWEELPRPDAQHGAEP